MRDWNWLVVAGIAAAALGPEGILAFALCFSPGWANQWPGGLSFHVVWSAGLAAVSAMMVATIGVAIGAVLATGRELLTAQPAGRKLIVIWLVIVIAVALVAYGYTYDGLHTAALAEFPNGYNPGGTGTP
jgi:hypothetical protein